MKLIKGDGEMNKLNLPWKYKFDEMGGYDCMSDAFNIIDSKGERIITIDLADFYDLDKIEAKKHCEDIAKLIIDKCNKDKLQELKK